MVYLLNVCVKCGNKTNNPKFCSKSCSASFNNKKRIRTKESKRKTSESLKKLGLKRPYCYGRIGRTWAKPPDASWESYKRKTNFYITKTILPLIKGYELFKTYGVYHPVNNPAGVVKDHRLSRKEGYLFAIDYKIIKHPANCEFLPHTQNNKKSRKSSITLDELKYFIESWPP